VLNLGFWESDDPVRLVNCMQNMHLWYIPRTNHCKFLKRSTNEAKKFKNYSHKYTNMNSNLNSDLSI
jgi:hypothetical protein